MKIKQALKEYLLEIEIRKYTPKTIRSYRNNLNLFVRFMEEEEEITEVEDITLASVKHFCKYMMQRGKKGTYINGLLKNAKSFIQYCYDEEYGGFNTKKNFRWCKEDKPIITTFTDEDVKRMLLSCSGSDFMALRDKAILSVFIETGIRCWELCCITPQDVRNDFIIINGKNHKQRVVPITPILKKALLKYENARENYFALKSVDDYYFLSFHGKQLTNSAVEHVIKRHSESIKGVRTSPHTLRHYFAQKQLKLGTDLFTISKLLGHENIGFTQTYLNSLRDEDVIQIAKQKSVLMSI